MAVPLVYTLAGGLLSIVSRRNSFLSYLQIWSPTAFKKVLEFNEPNSIVALPEFNKFIVHCELALSSYPLDKVIRVSRVEGDAVFQDLGASEEKLAQSDGDVLFLKAGRLDDLTVGKRLMSSAFLCFSYPGSYLCDEDRGRG